MFWDRAQVPKHLILDTPLILSNGDIITLLRHEMRQRLIADGVRWEECDKISCPTVIFFLLFCLHEKITRWREDGNS